MKRQSSVPNSKRDVNPTRFTRPKLLSRNLALGAVLALLLSSISVSSAQASVSPSGSCSGGGTVQLSGTVVTGNSDCKGDVILSGITAVGTNAFRRASISSVVIPDSVTSIGYGAFYETYSLSSVIFGAGSQLQIIGEFAFMYAFSLESIVIPSTVVTVDNHAFTATSSLSSVVFGAESQLQAIGENAFYGASSLRSISLPDSLVTIGQGAFYNNFALESVVFGRQSQLESIGLGAFAYSSAFSSIELPAGLAVLRQGAFYGATSLASVTFLGSAPATVETIVFSGVAQGAQARVSRQSVDSFTLTAGKWNGLEVVVPSETLTFRSEDQDLIQNVEFGAVPSAPTAVREGFNLVGWSTQVGGGTLLLADLSDFVMGLEPTTLFAVWEEIPRPEVEAETQEPVQFSGPLVSSVDRRVFDKGEPGTLTFKGKRMHLIRTVSENGVELKIRSVTRHSITLELPALAEGSHSLLVLSGSGSLSFRDFLSTR